MVEVTSNHRINADWQFRCAPLPAGYAERLGDFFGSISMIFKNKSPEELKREEFEKQCRLATQEVIARGNQKDKENGFGAAWPYEKIRIIKDGSITTRIRSSVFYWGSLLSLIAGIVLVSDEIYTGGIFILEGGRYDRPTEYLPSASS